MVTRDRFDSYAEAIRTGAPEAIQVADRFHLLHNLVDVVEKVLTRRYPCLQAVFQKTFAPPSEAEPSIEAPVNSPERKQKATRYEQQREQIRAKHQVQYDEIHRLKTEGMGIRAISRQLRISRDKVRRYLQNDQPPV